MAATVEPYLSLVAKAYDGRLKLPAFQRDWQWKTRQVILLFDSLRQGFPIGGFLFIKQNIKINLSPRDFRGAAATAPQNEHEFLVLDGQQRITAGLELFYGIGDRHYFIDLDALYRLSIERKVDLKNTPTIRKFLLDLDAEDDRYCVARKASNDPERELLKKHLLFTKFLSDEIELRRVLVKYKEANADRSEFVDFVVGNNFRPSANSHIPITSIDDDVTVEAVSRIFSTLNSTGKLLTPFELVVSILFPDHVDLVDDVETAKEAYPYYAKIDQTGDILLQTIALFADKDTKKASLPKTITSALYNQYRDEAVRYLNMAGQVLTERIGLGLDQSSELLVYPVIFSPMAYVLMMLSKRSLSVEEKATAERKLARWMIGAALSRRYQQSTHDKQARDKTEIMKWIDEGDENAPQWIKDTYVPNLKNSDPDSALGKLLRALMNANGLKDPLTAKPIGVGSGKQASAKHHVFPTKFVKNLKDWNEREDSANVALNMMYTEPSTNASFLNLDPLLQLQASCKQHSKAQVDGIYDAHGVTERCREIMNLPKKTRADFAEFLAEREKYFLSLLADWNFAAPVAPVGDPEEVVDD